MSQFVTFVEQFGFFFSDLNQEMVCDSISHQTKLLLQLPVAMITGISCYLIILCELFASATQFPLQTWEWLLA